MTDDPTSTTEEALNDLDDLDLLARSEGLWVPKVKGAVREILEHIDGEYRQRELLAFRNFGLLDDETSGDEDLPVRVDLTPMQGRYVRSDLDVQVCMSARGEGKTVASVVRLLRLAHDYPDVRPLRVALIRDTWRNLSRTSVPTLMDGNRRGWWSATMSEGGTRCLLNGNEVEILLMGMDGDQDANKFQSLEVGVAWLEEPAPASDLTSGIPASVFAMALSSLRQPGVPGSVQMSMNPPDQDHWTQELIEGIEERADPHFRGAVFRILTGENPYLPAGYRERMRIGLEIAGRADLVRRLVEGEVGDVKVGEPVTPEWSDQHIHRGADGKPAPIQIRLAWGVIRGHDAGLNPSTVWLQVSPWGTVHVLGCRVGVNVGMEEHLLENVIPWEAKYGLRTPVGSRPRTEPKDAANRFGWPGGRPMVERRVKFRDIGDPACFQRDQSNSERSAGLSLENLLDTTLETGPIAWPPRRDAMKMVLTRMIRGRPMVQVDADECVPLVRGLRGLWRYMKTASGKVSRLPVKDINSHPCAPQDTEMLTLDGWKRARQLQVGEPVWAYDLEAMTAVEDELRAVTVLDAGPYRVYEMIAEEVGVDMVVTADHRCVVSHPVLEGRRLIRGRPQLRTADMLIGRDYAIPPILDFADVARVDRLAAGWRPVPSRWAKVVEVPTVWCPTTRRGTWIARRHGCVFPTGNCDAMSYPIAKLFPVDEVTRRVLWQPRQPTRTGESWLGV